MSDYENALGRALMMAGPGDITTADMVGAMPKKGLARLLMEAAQGTQGQLDRLPWWAKGVAQPILAPGEAGLETARLGLSGVDNIQRGETTKGAAELGLAGLSVFPYTRTGMAAFNTVPRALTTGLGLGVGHTLGTEVANTGTLPSIGPISTANAQTPAHDLQQRLKQLGIYKGPIDGQIGRGTQQAIDQFRELNGLPAGTDISDALMQATDPEARRAAADAKLEADRVLARKLEAEAKTKETQRKSELDEVARRTTEQGNTWGTLAMQATPHVLGSLAGVLARKGITGIHNKLYGNAIVDAEKLAAGLKPGKAVTPYADDVAAQHMGSINAFYQRGGGTAPYSSLRDVPTGTTVTNPAALYEANKNVPRAINAGVYGIAGVDTGVFMGLEYKAKQDAAAAAERYARTGLEADLKEQIEKTQAANYYGFLGRLGPGMGIGYGLSSKFAKFDQHQPSPDSAKNVDAARMRLDEFLRQRNAPIQPSGTQAPERLPPPTGPQGPQPNRQQTQRPAADDPGDGGNPRSSFGAPDREKERAEIERRLRMSGPPPTADEMQQFVNKQLPANRAQKYDVLAQKVNDLRAKGMSDDAIADMIAKWMKAGTHGLPTIAAGTMGIGAMNFGNEPQN